MATSNTPVRDAVEQALADQPSRVLRKDGIAALIVLAVWLAQELAQRADVLPEPWAWAGTAVGVLASLGAWYIHRFTPGAITPSMAPRLETALGKIMEARRRQWESQQAHRIVDDGTSDYGQYTQG